MISTLLDLDAAELKTMAECKRCECGTRICMDDDLCPDCLRAAKDSEAWKEYCLETWGIRV